MSGLHRAGHRCARPASVAGALCLAMSLGACSSRGPDAGADAGATASAPVSGEAGVAVEGGGRITGTVTLAGTPPVMRPWVHREDFRDCGPSGLVSNWVLVRDGKLRDVLVRIAEDTPVPPERLPPSRPHRAILNRYQCVHEPRIQGVMVDFRDPDGTTIEFRNSDQTMHSVYPRLRKETVWGQGESLRGPPLVKGLGEIGIYVFTCSVHQWERAFVVTSSHPYFDVTGEGGTFVLQDVPSGSYTVEAWHSRYGWKRHAAIVVTAGATSQVDFAYSTSDPAPEENSDEGYWE